MLDIYIAGGVEYMHPVTLVLIVLLVMAGRLVFKKMRHQPLEESNFKVLLQLGMLGLALGTFGTIIGFFQALHALSEMTETLPFNVIMGGLKVALITVIYGLIVFIISMVLYFVLRMVLIKQLAE
jgi:hypothetical protein